MVRVEGQTWGQSLEGLRRSALQAEHPRTRERLPARPLIADGTHNATSGAARFGRQDDTALKWVHDSNSHGPGALTYRRTGGPAPLSRPTKPADSSRSSRTPSRSTTACPVRAGRRRSPGRGPWRLSARRSGGTPSAAGSARPS